MLLLMLICQSGQVVTYIDPIGTGKTINKLQSIGRLIDVIYKYVIIFLLSVFFPFETSKAKSHHENRKKRTIASLARLRYMLYF